MSGDAQIWTLVRAPHVYLDQSALRIFCDVTPERHAFHGSNFVQVVVAYFVARWNVIFSLHSKVASLVRVESETIRNLAPSDDTTRLSNTSRQHQQLS